MPSPRLYPVVFVTLLAAAPPVHAQVSQSQHPDSVVITLRAKSGQEDALAGAIARHWDTVRRLKLVREDLPHVTLSSIDRDHRTTFVEIFTWRDGSIPDAAPAAILAIWQELNELVEARGGQPGLEVANVTLLDPRVHSE